MTTTNVLAWVHFARQPSELYNANLTDGSEGELTSQAASASLGDVAGQVVTAIEVQASDGSILNYLGITDSSGGQTLRVGGGERDSVSQSSNSNLNACVQNLGIMVERGMTLDAKTAD